MKSMLETRRSGERECHHDTKVSYLCKMLTLINDHDDEDTESLIILANQSEIESHYLLDI